MSGSCHDLTVKMSGRVDAGLEESRSYAYRVVFEPDPTAVWRIAAILATSNSVPILFKAEQSADAWVEAICVIYCGTPAIADLISRKLQQLPFITEVQVTEA